MLAIAAGVAVGLLWVRRQRRLADPMIDVGLFRIRAFNVALVVNFMAIFVMVGYFLLYLAQYLQLVLGLSPLEAGLWSVPGAAGSSSARSSRRGCWPGSGRRSVVAGGLAAAAAGLVGADPGRVDHGLVELVVASVVISLGMGPVFGLTTEMIVGSAPAEKAGAASGISETAAELGGALGIAVLGSVGVAIYRSGVAAGLPAGVPTEAAAAARDTLGGAVGGGRASCPVPAAEALLDAARAAFVTGLQLTSAVAAVIAAVIAVVAAVALRESGAPAADETDQTDDDEATPVPCAC